MEKLFISIILEISFNSLFMKVKQDIFLNFILAKVGNDIKSISSEITANFIVSSDAIILIPIYY